MQINRTVTETLTDDHGKEIRPGMTIIYSQKTSRDNVGQFVKLADGFMLMRSITTGDNYKLRPNNITRCEVILITDAINVTDKH